MNVFDSILLGLIQGLTEFIPISSTAHLTLAGKLLGLVDSQTAAAWTEFIAVIQMGTLTAVVLYFSRDVFTMAKAVLEDLRTRLAGNFSAALSEHAKMGWLVTLGTVPVAVIGLLFNHEIHGWFTKSTTVIIFSLIVLAVLLWIAEKVARHARHGADLTRRRGHYRFCPGAGPGSRLVTVGDNHHGRSFPGTFQGICGQVLVPAECPRGFRERSVRIDEDPG